MSLKKLKYLYQKNYKKRAKPYIEAILNGSKMIGADVGAAFGLPPHWRSIEGGIIFYIFEPHPDSYNWLVDHYKKSKYPDSFEVLNIGLSKTGGSQILYILNQETGSSLFPVDTNHPQVTLNNPYIYPIKEIEIETKSLKQVLDNYNEPYLDMIKLDIQGAELDVVLGLGNKRLNTITSIEMEVGFDSIYKGAPKPIDVENILKKFDLELFDLNIVRAYSTDNESRDIYTSLFKINAYNESISAKLQECDMLFFRNSKSLLEKRDAIGIRKLIVAYCTYNFFFDAVQLTQRAKEEAIISESEISEIIENIQLWYFKVSKKWYQSSFFNNLKKKMSPIIEFGQYSSWQTKN